jgi:DNA-3-methyladenine glycosylase II
MTDVYSIFPNSAGKNETSNYRQYTRILSKHPALKKVINSVGSLGFDIPIWLSINDAVIYAVIGQMLSISASASIINRLYQEFGSSCAVLEWAQKSCYKKGPIRGVSQRKRKALRVWRLYAKNNYGKWKKWTKMPLSEYREEICSIWGFGRWSADMIAIFHLGRMDVWPETDSGIQKSSRLVFGIDNYDTISRLISGCETVAALYLWELINKKLLFHFRENYSG